MARVSLSGEEKSIETIAEWYEDQKEAIRDLRTKVLTAITNPGAVTGINTKFVTFTADEIIEYFNDNEIELEHLVCFDLISAAEARLRVDFYKKVYNKSKSKTGEAFRESYKLKQNKISLEEDIIETWKAVSASNKKFFSEFLGLLNYRHWLAHGRYWSKKLGQEYTYDTTYNIVERMLSKLSN